MAGFSQGRSVVNADEKKRKLTGQMAFFFRNSNGKPRLFFLYKIHDEIQHRKQKCQLLLCLTMILND